jgi:hypothetical protein
MVRAATFSLSSPSVAVGVSPSEIPPGVTVPTGADRRRFPAGRGDVVRFCLGPYRLDSGWPMSSPSSAMRFGKETHSNISLHMRLWKVDVTRRRQAEKARSLLGLHRCLKLRGVPPRKSSLASLASSTSTVALLDAWRKMSLPGIQETLVLALSNKLRLPKSPGFGCSCEAQCSSHVIFPLSTNPRIAQAGP